MFPLRIAGAGIEAARNTAMGEPGVTLPLTTNERDSGGGAGEENDLHQSELPQELLLKESAASKTPLAVQSQG